MSEILNIMEISLTKLKNRLGTPAKDHKIFNIYKHK